ncbi:hypothetical protein CONPUDRAFT_85598 [Coniophora puteana RWD-64-598 SS2]|uniref:Uncharacterized protein n=1 Tax=Coniophora puteana (strain RWD-64-598) TaxID=741705 RepID=A0A5M3M7G0_CONPW|nr:uncharacterized protein CONPUDRAFT_85598 [Coniophora puteana RWD-64-598 SS2]EIW74794.1 hypothetical protein CONPUDRAFT_85598 [Coniophora puteana RWD-64-598 SS2]
MIPANVSPRSRENGFIPSQNTMLLGDIADEVNSLVMISKIYGNQLPTVAPNTSTHSCSMGLLFTTSAGGCLDRTCLSVLFIPFQSTEHLQTCTTQAIVRYRYIYHVVAQPGFTPLRGCRMLHLVD